MPRSFASVALSSFVLLLFAAASGLVVAGGRIASPWETWAPATCRPNSCFCEALRSSAVQQPVDAASSLSFVLAAFGILTYNRWLENAGLPSSRADAALFSGALTVVGLGSCFFHSSLTFTGQTLDVLGMYLIVTAVLLWSLKQLFRIDPAIAVFGYLGGNTALLAGLVVLPAARRYVFGALVLTVLGLAYLARRTWDSAAHSYMGRAIAVLGAGFAFWIADITKLVCWPSSVLQGHAVWHIAGAFASGLVYMHYHGHQISQP